jgi:hypothetical protein
MLYNDKETRETEKHFQEDLKTARSFAEDKEAQQRITESLVFLNDILTRLKEKPDKTPEDIELMNDLMKRLKPILEKIQHFKNVVDHNRLRFANANYENVKKLAAEGNEEAKAIYEDLKPAYQKMMKEQMDEHLQ